MKANIRFFNVFAQSLPSVSHLNFDHYRNTHSRFQAKMHIPLLSEHKGNLSVRSYIWVKLDQGVCSEEVQNTNGIANGDKVGVICCSTNPPRGRPVYFDGPGKVYSFVKVSLYILHFKRFFFYPIAFITDIPLTHAES